MANHAFSRCISVACRVFRCDVPLGDSSHKVTADSSLTTLGPDQAASDAAYFMLHSRPL